MNPVYAIRKENSPAFGMTTTVYGYVTELSREKDDGTKYNQFWLADIDEEVIENPETFQIDPSPCGFRLKPEDVKSFSKRDNVIKIGYIENGKLIITKSIEVETAWGSGLDGLRPTKLRKVGRNKN